MRFPSYSFVLLNALSRLPYDGRVGQEMREADERENMAPRFLWAGLLALLGFVHPLFFLFAALIGASAWFGLNPNEAERQAPRARRCFVEAADPEWRDCFLGACESPAEEAFLEQAIRHFELAPANGVLAAPGLALHLQVEIGSYRVDFLAHDWLVIEVDGAAWHSSEAAVARDRERDRFLEGEGYRVLRLPAKLVFNRPVDAMRRVEAAIAAGRPEKPLRSRPEVDFGKALSGLSDFVLDVNRSATRMIDVQAAMQEPRRIVEHEQKLVESAIEIAERQIRIAEFRAKNPEHAGHFDEAHKRLSQAVENQRSGSPRQPAHELIHLGPVVRPSAHADPETRQAIENAFQGLLKDRSALFARIRKRAAEDQRLASHAVTFLEKFGCGRLWREVIGDSGASEPSTAADFEKVLPPLRKRSFGKFRGTLPIDDLAPSSVTMPRPKSSCCFPMDELDRSSAKVPRPKT